MYRKSDDFPLDFLDFGQIMAIENLKNNFFLAFFIFNFHFWLYIDHQQKEKKAGS
jgi:hypothetical protein